MTQSPVYDSWHALMTLENTAALAKGVKDYDYYDRTLKACISFMLPIYNKCLKIVIFDLLKDLFDEINLLRTVYQYCELDLNDVLEYDGYTVTVNDKNYPAAISIYDRWFVFVFLYLNPEPTDMWRINVSPDYTDMPIAREYKLYSISRDTDSLKCWQDYKRLKYL